MNDLAPQSFRLAIGQAVVLEFRRPADPGESLAGRAMRFRLFRPDGTAVEVTTASGGVAVVDGPAAWGWDVAVADTDTGTLPAALLPWDLWRTDDGSENPEAYGTADVFSTQRG